MIPEYRIDFLQRALGHRYEFQAFLGRGAFATVLLVRNIKLGRQEALKVLQESFDGDHEFAKRFVDEARLIASLDHPNIVKVYDYGDVDGVLWYSMQYIAGPSLSTEIEARNPLSQREAISLAVPLLDALAYSHGVGIVHRDVKPGNVMISHRGRPYLMDFGIAKVKDSGFKTATGSVLGTPAYISPEQASGEAVDGRSDVYSLGVCLYQLLAGSLPFPAPDPIQMLLRRLREDPEPLSMWVPSIEPELEAIVLKSLARAKEDRFQSAGEMRDRILETFRRQVDSEAIRITAVVQDPTPLKESAQHSRQATPQELAAGSEAPTIVTQAGGAKDSRRRPPAIFLASLAGVFVLIAVVMVFIWPKSAPELPEDQPTPGAQAVSQSLPLPKNDPDVSTGGTPIGSGPPPAGLPAEDPATAPSTDGSSADPVSQNGSAAESDPPADMEAPPPRTSSQDPAAPRRREPAASAVTQPESPPARRAVVPPAILEAPVIELDEITSQTCASIEVVLTVSVDIDGLPGSSRALAAPNKTCEAAALEHIKSYRFKPGMDFDNQPVPSKLTLSIRFP